MADAEAPGPYQLEGSVLVQRKPMATWAWQNPSETAPKPVRLPGGQVYVWPLHWLVKDEEFGWRVLDPDKFESLYGDTE